MQERRILYFIPGGYRSQQIIQQACVGEKGYT